MENSSIDKEEYLTRYGRFWGYFDDKGHDDQNAVGAYEIIIGYGAALAFYVTISDENLDENDIDLNREDQCDPFKYID